MRPSFQLSTFNHDRLGVGDQVEALKDVFGQQADLDISNDLSKSTALILIENFNAYQIKKIRRAKKQTGRKIFVLLTEHIRLAANDFLYLNDEAWNVRREYIPDLYHRFLTLVELSDVIDGFITLCGEPELSSIRSVFPAKPIFDLNPVRLWPQSSAPKDHDFCFIGSLTDYRRNVLSKMSQRFKVFHATGVSAQERSAIIGRSSFSLNIPQHPAWTKISPMRILAAAREGVVTLHLSEHGEAHFPYCAQISLDDLLAMSQEAIESRWAYESLSPSSDCMKSDLEHFCRWAS